MQWRLSRATAGEFRKPESEQAVEFANALQNRVAFQECLLLGGREVDRLRKHVHEGLIIEGVKQLFRDRFLGAIAGAAKPLGHALDDLTALLCDLVLFRVSRSRNFVETFDSGNAIGPIVVRRLLFEDAEPVQAEQNDVVAPVG